MGAAPDTGCPAALDAADRLVELEAESGQLGLRMAALRADLAALRGHMAALERDLRSFQIRSFRTYLGARCPTLEVTQRIDSYMEYLLIRLCWFILLRTKTRFKPSWRMVPKASRPEPRRDSFRP